MGVWGLGFEVWGFGFGVWGLGLMGSGRGCPEGVQRVVLIPESLSKKELSPTKCTSQTLYYEY